MINQIFIYDEIGGPNGILAKSILPILDNDIDAEINININSSGGGFFEGMTIYNAIKNYKGKTIAQIDGIAYGIAGIIALACDSISMSPNSYFVLSEPSSFVMGSSDDMKKECAELDKIKNVMAEIYMGRFKKTKNEIFKMMEDETWLTRDSLLNIIYN